MIVSVFGHLLQNRQQLTEQAGFSATGSLIGGSAQLGDTNQLSSRGGTSFNGGLNTAESSKALWRVT